MWAPLLQGGSASRRLRVSPCCMGHQGHCSPAPLPTQHDSCSTSLKNHISLGHSIPNYLDKILTWPDTRPAPRSQLTSARLLGLGQV